MPVQLRVGAKARVRVWGFWAVNGVRVICAVGARIAGWLSLGTCRKGMVVAPPPRWIGRGCAGGLRWVLGGVGAGPRALWEGAE